MHRCIDLLGMSLPDAQCHEHVRAHGKAGKQADEQHHDRSGATDCSQRLGTHEAAGHRGIRRIEKLLEHTGQRQRYCKLDDFQRQRAIQHVDGVCFLAHSKPALYPFIVLDSRHSPYLTGNSRKALAHRDSSSRVVFRPIARQKPSRAVKMTHGETHRRAKETQ